MVWLQAVYFSLALRATSQSPRKNKPPVLQARIRRRLILCIVLRTYHYSCFVVSISYLRGGNVIFVSRYDQALCDSVVYTMDWSKIVNLSIVFFLNSCFLSSKNDFYSVLCRVSNKGRARQKIHDILECVCLEEREKVIIYSCLA